MCGFFFSRVGHTHCSLGIRAALELLAMGMHSWCSRSQSRKVDDGDQRWNVKAQVSHVPGNTFFRESSTSSNLIHPSRP